MDSPSGAAPAAPRRAPVIPPDFAQEAAIYTIATVFGWVATTAE